jgi:hypothetical protein
MHGCVLDFRREMGPRDISHRFASEIQISYALFRVSSIVAHTGALYGAEKLNACGVTKRNPRNEIDDRRKRAEEFRTKALGEF